MICLRPHHLIDIIRNIGQERPVVPHPYGHAQHVITAMILDHTVKEVKFIIGADDLCGPCIHLDKNGLCNDVLPQLDTKPSKQCYNDELDHRVMDYLGIHEGEIMQLDCFIDLIGHHLTELCSICTHPKEDRENRLSGMEVGIKKLKSL
jgi:hypothetical protein